jgi:hypothetical protein
MTGLVIEELKATEDTLSEPSPKPSEAVTIVGYSNQARKQIRLLCGRANKGNKRLTAA